ncbi:hypothetical protein PG993_011143 [Apiospora rasikravindrae]|uniref:Uncharacterized protein n=1 Tax=Apiospora rasikravindrae TaxID=990691 RepID=A0ABR1SDD7_9PEZI
MAAETIPRNKRVACPFHSASFTGIPALVHDKCDRLGFADMSHLHEHLKQIHYPLMLEHEETAIRALFHRSQQRVSERDKWFELFVLCFPHVTPPDSHYHFLLSDFLDANPEHRWLLHQNLPPAFQVHFQNGIGT